MTERCPMPRWQQVAAALGKAACYLALFLGWQMVVSMAFTAAITVDLALSGQMFDEWAMYDVVVSKSMEISLLSDLLTLGSVAALFALRRKRPDREVWLRPAAKTVVLWGMGLAFCLYWLVSLVLGALPESWTQSYAEASSSVEQTGVLAVLATAIVAPVVEEVVFRGLIFTRLRAVCPGWVAVVVSAAIFGACHGELIWFCYAFVLGLIFALMTEKTGSILPGMVMHLVFNSTNEAYMLLLDGLEPMMGDEPGVVYVVMFGVIPFLLATVGTVVCALRLRAAVSAAPVPFVAEKPGTGETVSEAVPAVQCQETPRTAGAAWDQDSGPNHKFPPQRM